MRTTIDKAGRLVIPKSLRDRLGLRPGAVEVVVDGAELRVAPVIDDELIERDGRTVIPSRGERLTTEEVQDLIDADRR